MPADGEPAGSSALTPPGVATSPSRPRLDQLTARSSAARPAAGSADAPSPSMPLHSPGHWVLRPGMMALWGLGSTALALGILLCALALVALAGATSLAGGPWRPLGDQVGGAVERSAQAAATSAQAVRDAFDPSHPPREALRQDTEFDALVVVPVGEALGTTAQSRVELARLAKRADARDVASAQHGLVRRVLVTPQPRRILGVPAGEDRGEQEHYLYQGQSFRLGAAYYKVNWVSVDRQQMAIARYRSADGVLGRLVFEYD
jgi:hypothetical protein